MVNRMIIQQRLKKDGHEVVVAEHGGAAVRKFEEDRTGFDIVLMDLQMCVPSSSRRAPASSRTQS